MVYNRTQNLYTPSSLNKLINFGWTLGGGGHRAHEMPSMLHSPPFFISLIFSVPMSNQVKGPSYDK